VIIQFPVYEDQTRLLGTIRFLGNVTDILPEDWALPDRIGEMLNRDKGLSVLITGHTARFGSEANAVELALDRAKLISRYLITRWSIPAERIRIWGYGSDKPLAANDTRAGRQLNRRVEVRVRTE
jgi:OOP family OmpA-OmpF porin